MGRVGYARWKINKELKRESLEKYCEKKGFVLADNADEIIAVINKRNGQCPCRIDGTKCLCPYHLDEIAEMGHCHCRLIYRNEDARIQDTRQGK